VQETCARDVHCPLGGAHLLACAAVQAETLVQVHAGTVVGDGAARAHIRASLAARRAERHVERRPPAIRLDDSKPAVGSLLHTVSAVHALAAVDRHVANRFHLTRGVADHVGADRASRAVGDVGDVPAGREYLLVDGHPPYQERKGLHLEHRDLFLPVHGHDQRMRRAERHALTAETACHVDIDLRLLHHPPVSQHDLGEGDRLTRTDCGTGAAATAGIVNCSQLVTARDHRA